MEIQLTAKHLKVTPAIRDYVRQKVEKAQRYFDHIVWGQVFLFIEKRAHNCEILIHAPNRTIRALATAADLYSAVDLASDKIDAQLKKFKEKLKGRHKNEAVAVPLAAPAPAPAALRAQVIKQAVRPMSAAEAVEQMESLGRRFQLYEDRDTRQIQVVYRADDESYKILQPVKKAR